MTGENVVPFPEPRVLKVIITEREIARHLPGTVLRDAAEPLLQIRIGRRVTSWSLYGRLPGTQFTRKIGTWPEMSISAARFEAERVRRAIAAGTDPGLTERAEVMTMDRLVDIYVSSRVGEAQSTPKKYARTIRNHAGKFLATPIAAISPAALGQLVTELRATKHPTARILAQALRTVFKLAHEEGLLARHAGSRIPSVPTRPRERVPTLDEMRAVWLATASWPGWMRRFTRVIMLAGTRRGETAAMRRADLRDGVWWVRTATTKKKSALNIPLPRIALTEIDLALGARQGRETLVFVNAAGHSFTNHSFDQINQRIREVVPPNEEGSITLHSFRAGMASALQEAEFDEVVIDKSLSHQQSATSNQVRNIYLRNKRIRERREMHETWATMVTAGCCEIAVKPLAWDHNSGRVQAHEKKG